MKALFGNSAPFLLKIN